MDKGFLSESPLSNEISRDEIITLAEQIWNVSPECALAFIKACPSIVPFLKRDEVFDWDFIFGRTLALASGSNTLSKKGLFPSSPNMSTVSFHYLKDWAEMGLEIAKRSSDTAKQYFFSTQDYLKKGEVFQIRRWARWIIQFLDTENSNENVAITFVLSSTDMLESLPFREFQDWISTAFRILKHSDSLTSTYLSIMPEGLDYLYRRERSRVFKLVSAIAKIDPEKAIEFYRRCPDILLDLSPDVQHVVLDSAINHPSKLPEKIIAIFDKIASSIKGRSYPTQESVMVNGDLIRKISFNAFDEYLRNIEFLLDNIPEIFLPYWVKTGIDILNQDEYRGINFFSLESEDSLTELSKWREAILLEDCRSLLSLFAQALSGKDIQVQSTNELITEKDSKPTEYSISNSRTIYLPFYSAFEKTREYNFLQYKTATAHHSAYVESGVYESGLALIINLLGALPKRELAIDIFFILLDSLIDISLRKEFAGLSQDLDTILKGEMQRRNPPDTMPLQEALIEILLRLSVGLLDNNEIPASLSEYVDFLKSSISGFYENDPTIWDCYYKSLHLYNYISRLPNILPDILKNKKNDVNTAQKDIFPYIPFAPIPFRGRIEIDQLTDIEIHKILTETGIDAEMLLSLSAEDLKNLFDNLTESLTFEVQDGKDLSSDGLTIKDIDEIIDNAGASKTEMDEPMRWKPPTSSDASRSNEQEGPFYYDEWDYLQGAYRRKWCCIWEKMVEPLDTKLVNDIYANYSDLILNVRRQFQRIHPEFIETVRRVEWGDEIDLDAVIQGRIDRRAGEIPSERIFSRKEKRIRRISTLLLIDISASTSKFVPCLDHLSISENKPATGLRDENEKMIIDIEIESLVVLLEALDALGDDYAIYGFSGSGRHQVDFYPIKNFQDPYSEIVKKRISGIRPKQSTRMGAAIRHAAEKLRPLDSDQRLLILLSDGFPQDQDYGEDRRSNEYALNDTMMALLEARRQGIRPFCITVDKSGNDYLRKMCDPNSYLVIQDIFSLPEVLPKVVESLMI